MSNHPENPWPCRAQINLYGHLGGEPNGFLAVSFGRKDEIGKEFKMLLQAQGHQNILILHRGCQVRCVCVCLFLRGTLFRLV